MTDGGLRVRKIMDRITWVRWLLGVQLLVNGVNWWIKILPFPSVSDPPGMPLKYPAMGAILDSGWMFPLAKLIETATGLALLLDVFVPLMLVVSFPIVLSTFLFDAFIFEAFIGWARGSVNSRTLIAKVLDMLFFGGAVLCMQAYLMFSYLSYYRPLLSMHAKPGTTAHDARADRNKVWPLPLKILGVVALLLGVLATGWIVGMIRQWIVPWSSLSLLAPP